MEADIIVALLAGLFLGAVLTAMALPQRQDEDDAFDADQFWRDYYREDD